MSMAIGYDSIPVKEYAKTIVDAARIQAEKDWEYIETSIWGNRYPHKKHRDDALCRLAFGFSVGSAFRVCSAAPRKRLPRQLKLQLIFELSNAFRRISKSYEWQCDCDVNTIIEEMEVYEECRERNSYNRFKDCLTYGRFDETAADTRDIMVVVSRVTVGLMVNCFDEEAGFLFRKNEKCARLIASSIDAYYSNVYPALLQRVSELSANDSYKKEVIEIPENPSARLVSQRTADTFDLLPTNIGKELDRCNELPGYYPHSLETVLLLALQKYKQLEAQRQNSGPNFIVDAAINAFWSNVVLKYRRDKVSMALTD